MSALNPEELKQKFGLLFTCPRESLKRWQNKHVARSAENMFVINNG